MSLDKVTIVEVAKLANTSIATVSRVINNNDYVSEAARIRVENAINELNYKPLVLTRNSVRKGLKTIGILVPDLNNLFFSQEIMGIEDEFEKFNYSILLCNTYENIQKEIKYINDLKKKNVDGIILMGARSKKNANDHIVALSKEMPMVMINDYIIGSDVYAVMIDVVNGAYKAVKYLIELGHKKIAFINGSADNSTYNSKHNGYVQALKNNGIALNERYMLKVEPYEDGGYYGVQKLLQLKDPPTAIFTASDQIALGAISAIYEAGFTIPKDFSIVGFSNIPLSKRLFPSLTTVDQFPYKTGTMAANILLKAINGEELGQRKIILEPELLVRNSCAGMGENNNS